MSFEEILPLFSEALTRKDVKLNSSSLKKISDFFRQVFQNVGLKKIKFDTSEGVVNFIKDYNKAYSKGEFKGALKTLSEGDIKKSVEISLSKNKELGCLDILNQVKLKPDGKRSISLDEMDYHEEFQIEKGFIYRHLWRIRNIFKPVFIIILGDCF